MDRGRGRRDDQINVRANQLGRGARRGIAASVRPSLHEIHGLPLDVSALAQRLTQSFFVVGVAHPAEDADLRHRPGRLRSGDVREREHGERPVEYGHRRVAFEASIERESTRRDVQRGRAQRRA